MAGDGLGGALTSPSPSQSASVRQLFEAAKASASLYLSSLNDEASGNDLSSILTVSTLLNDLDFKDNQLL